MAPEICLSAEQLATLETVPQEIGPPQRTTTQARTVQVFEKYAKAERLDYCGRFRMDGCENGHRFHIETFHCRTNFCLNCAPILVQERFERWIKRVEFIQAHYAGHRFSYATVYQPVTNSPFVGNQMNPEFIAERNEFLNSVEDKVREASHETSAHPLWTQFVGYCDGMFVLRLIYMGPEISTPVWESLWPDGVVESKSIQAKKLVETFQRLIAPYLPNDPVQLGELEVMFDGMRRFRSSGMKLVTESQNPSVTNFEEEPREVSNAEPDPPPRKHLCPICGEEAIKVSQWFPREAPPPLPSQIKWRDLKKH